MSYARVLADSITNHNPDLTLYVLLADQLDQHFDPKLEPFQLIQLSDLPDQKLIQQMCFYYTPFELCCALRGFLHEFMWQQTRATSWLFLDSDIMVFGCLTAIFRQLETTSILLSPHNQGPVPREHIELHEVILTCSGVYNGGFLGLSRTETTRSFIKWYKERLAYYCFDDRSKHNPRGIFVDQTWLHLVPVYFPDYQLLLHPGANLGHWNLFEKNLTEDKQGNTTVNGKPLLFVHFSGWDIEKPAEISKHAPVYQGQAFPVWEKIAQQYRQALLNNDYEISKKYSYKFGWFHTGQPILDSTRRLYHQQLMKKLPLPTDPFDAYLYFRDQDPNTSRRLKPLLWRSGKFCINQLAKLIL